ncbi:hypothetical protein FLA_6435 [Filimonas lacunae]|nr:hypothetical protein FLA_6435 [Filimonas lacunae]
MDDLFRNAADNYPLKTGDTDWDTVMAKLHPEGNGPSFVEKGGAGKWYRVLWLLLLTPLCFVAHLPKFTFSHTPALAQQTTSRQVSTVTTLNEEKQENIPSPEKKSLQNIPPQATPEPEHAYQLKKERIPAGRKKMTGTDREQNYSLTTKEPARKVNKLLEIIERQHITADTATKADSLPTVNDMVSSRPDTAAKDNTTFATGDAGKDSAVVVKELKKEKKKGLYIGALVSPDISTVKGQQVNNVGYGFGVIVGYQFSKKLAVETGLLWDRKYYYSKGEYFNTKKLTYPNANIVDVDGWCRMFELPLNVRYFFKTGKKSSWYANLGVSSYLMNRESYDYAYLYNNQVHNANWKYDNATRNWLNIIHTGIGYERPMGVLGTLRIEPYLKASIGGVGVGSLPLTSFGINVGITRSVKF